MRAIIVYMKIATERASVGELPQMLALQRWLLLAFIDYVFAFMQSDKKTLRLVLPLVADRMNHQLYEKSLDAQEGLLLSVLEDVISQILKRVRISLVAAFPVALFHAPAVPGEGPNSLSGPALQESNQP